MEPVFRTLEIAGALAVRATGTTLTFVGLENIPGSGGAVVAINHTSYIDFLPAALAATERKRRLRFMIKSEMNSVRGVRFLIKHARTIPVDRSDGRGAYALAVQRLRQGELVAIYPEATISRSFELKEFKSGAARMAEEARVPLIPLIVWGAHRMWTKDHRKSLGRNHIPITVAVGPALPPNGTVEQLDAGIFTAMDTLLRQVQETYEHPPGRHWVPHRLGGSAPTPAQAEQMEETEMAERMRRRAEEAEAE